MRVMALDVSKGKSYVVIYEEEVCIAEWEIKHNQEGFNQLKSQLCKETTEVVFEATGVYSKQIETFLKTERISYCILNPLLAKKQTDGLRGNKTDKVDAHKLAQSHYRFDREKKNHQTSIYSEIHEVSILYDEVHNSLIKQRVQLHAVLQQCFPEIETLYSSNLSKYALKIIERFPHPAYIKELSKTRIKNIILASTKKNISKEEALLKADELIHLADMSYPATVALTETKQIHIDRFDNRYIKKAIQRLEFYQFDNLKKYLPLLESMKEFIYGENWLNASKLKLFLTAPKEYKSTDITADEILKVTIDLLKEYEVKFKSGYVKKRGTSRFVGYPISEYLTNYNKRVPEYDTANLLNEATQKVAVYDMAEDFYVYDRAIVNKLEFDLITRIQAHVNELKAKYNKAVYLFRMDENMHRESAKSEKLKLHQYGSRINRAGEIVDMHLQGFQPDFILFLEDSAFYFQIFIEPKGMSGDRFVSELWKQDLLLYMTDHQAEMEFEDGVDNIKISGLKFFTAKDGQNTIPELMAMSGVTYQKPNEQIDLLMVADPSTEVIIEEDE